MKKTILVLVAMATLSGCAGFVQGRSASGKTTHDMYILHPAITISGYTSQM